MRANVLWKNEKYGEVLEDGDLFTNIKRDTDREKQIFTRRNG